jgi:hypothetical protein
MQRCLDNLTDQSDDVFPATEVGDRLYFAAPNRAAAELLVDSAELAGYWAKCFYPKSRWIEVQVEGVTIYDFSVAPLRMGKPRAK